LVLLRPKELPRSGTTGVWGRAPSKSRDQLNSNSIPVFLVDKFYVTIRIVFFFSRKEAFILLSVQKTVHEIRGIMRHGRLVKTQTEVIVIRGRMKMVNIYTRLMR
jgi:hypothetical protein